MSKIKPLGSNILIKLIKEKEDDHGLIIPENSSSKKPDRAKVIAIGNSKNIKVGDIVIFSKYGFEEVDEYLIGKEDDILALIK